MTHGFGTPKHPTEKEIATFKNLIRRKDYDAFCRYRDKLELEYGSKPIDNLLSGDPELFWEYRQILPRQLREELDQIVQPKAEAMMFQQFAEWGFQPGTDFSIGSHNGNRAFWFSDRLRDHLQTEGFPIEELMSKQSPAIVPDPVEQLDEHLSIPFTQNLIASLATTAATEDPKLTLTKVLYLCQGLERANPQIPWFEFLVVNLTAHLGDDWNDRLDASYQAMQEFFRINPDAHDGDWCTLPPEGWWLELLCRSLEIELMYADLGNGKEEPLFGTEDCERLHQVWRGERFSFLELADGLKKAKEDRDS